MNSSSNDIAFQRINIERQQWRKDHPHGFVAKPIKNQDGQLNLLKWECQIPGPKESPWYAGIYTLHMDFTNAYPMKPPKCQFKPVIPHPNIYPTGTVCLSILNEEEDWKSSITIKTILLGIQKLLKDEPNIESPAQYEPCAMYRQNREEYIKTVKQFAAKTVEFQNQKM